MWTNDVVLRLIELYKSCECLWNTTNDDYKNKAKKNDGWEEIARTMNLPRREAEMKVHSLRSQFIRERKKIKMTIETGGIVKSSTWFAYEALMFLIKGENPPGPVDIVYNKEIKQDLQSINDSEETNQKTETYSELDDAVEVNKNKSNITNERKRLNEDSFDSNTYSKASKKTTDEFDIYGQYVASELRNVKSEEGMLLAKYYINNIIIDARRGKLDPGSNYIVEVKQWKRNDIVHACTSKSEQFVKECPENKSELTDLILVVKCEPENDNNV